MFLVGIFGREELEGASYLFTVGVLNEGCERIGYIRCMPAVRALV
jgi:hypothetical protein